MKNWDCVSRAYTTKGDTLIGCMNTLVTAAQNSPAPGAVFYSKNPILFKILDLCLHETKFGMLLHSIQPSLQHSGIGILRMPIDVGIRRHLGTSLWRQMLWYFYKKIYFVQNFLVPRQPGAKWAKFGADDATRMQTLTKQFQESLKAHKPLHKPMELPMMTF